MKARQNRCTVTGLATLVVLTTMSLAGALRAEDGNAIVPDRIDVFPPKIEIARARQSRQLIVSGMIGQRRVIDLTHDATFESSNPEVVAVSGGRVSALTDGDAKIHVEAAGHSLTIPVSVSGQSRPNPVSFRFETLPALSKQGCNAGACHGSPSGKGGFRLSLRAFDPPLDQLTLIREDFGRRTNPHDPARSLLLMKPLMKLPHGGGKRLHQGSVAYDVLHQWIAEGCRLDAPEQAECTGIEIYPPSGSVLEQPAHQQQLSVLAHFADGSVQDITPLAVYTSSDEEVASVTASGLVTGNTRGEAAIVVRYLQFIESSFITFVRNIDGYAWPETPTQGYIDELVNQKLKQLQFVPGEVCTDPEFLRRVYLDVTGLLPNVEQTRRFLQDPAADKRQKLIDELLERPEYAQFWALKWGDLLRMTKGQVGPDGVYKYHRWLQRAIADNMPYDEFARQLLAATGSTMSNPPANFYRTAADANDCVETVSQIFLGARLQCAKCHNHPFERWTQDNYYGMAAFFNRIQRQPTRRDGEFLIWVARQGEVTQPRTQQRMLPWLPEVGELKDASEDDRRQTFVDWLTRPDNSFFARIEVNRIWSHVFGRGIVDPPDDFRDSNPPSNAALLDALAADFVKSGYDRKHVLRTILNSRTYQASYRPHRLNQDDTKYFSHYQPRLLTAEQLLDAICHVTSLEEQFKGLPPGTKATQLPAPDLVDHEFLKAFGQPERQTVCQCERSTQSNLSMAIQCFNGPLIYNKLRADNNRFRKLMTAGKSDREIIEELHLAAVSRPATEQEQQASLAHIRAKLEATELQNQQLDAQVAQLRTELETLRQDARTKLLESKLKTVPEAIRNDTKAALLVAAEKRNEIQKYLVARLGPQLQVTDKEIDAALTEDVKKQLADLQNQITELSKQKRTAETARIEAMEDICWAVMNTNEFLFQH